jgi:radical SAM protein with 4Fe4S-binding SPASM domain
MHTSISYRLKKDTFIRYYDDFVYITNQTTGKDRVYDKAGKEFLIVLERSDKSINEMSADLKRKLAGEDENELNENLSEFLEELEKEGFIISGQDKTILNSKDTGFSYDDENPKTIRSFISGDSYDDISGSSGFMEEYFDREPHIFSVHLEITNNCNQVCIHCYQPNHHDGHMPMDMIETVFSQLGEMGTLSITISGGEPLLHPNFKEIIKLAREKDMVINILSNGTLIDDAAAKFLEENNISMVQVTLFSMDEGIHDKITCRPYSLKKALAGIENLIANNVPVQVNCPVLTLNYRSYFDIALWCHKRRIRVLSDFVLMAKSDFDTSNLAYRINTRQAEVLIKDILKVDSDYKELIKLNPEKRQEYRNPERAVCGIGISNICISFEGKVYPCSGFSGLVLGDLNITSLPDIWENSPKINELRSIKHSNFPQCLVCEVKDYCVMCLVRNYNENKGDFFSLNKHYCDIAFLNKKLVEEGLMI